MQSEISRRGFVAGLGLLAANSSLSSAQALSAAGGTASSLSKSPFKIAVINDEISQDFGHACEVASKQFGMGWMELRSMWDKNIAALDTKEIDEAIRLRRRAMRVASCERLICSMNFLLLVSGLE